MSDAGDVVAIDKALGAAAVAGQAMLLNGDGRVFMSESRIESSKVYRASTARCCCNS